MKVLIFGATGSAGGSVVQACLASRDVAEARTITRRPLEIAGAKLRAWIHADYLDYSAVAEAFDGIDACMFCLGISARQVPVEAEYRVITQDFAMAAARMMLARSPDAVFHYLSGSGASLNSRMMWARVKAEAEQSLMQLAGAVCWRPASIDGADSATAPKLYQAMRPVMRLFKPFRSIYIRGEDIGYAMLEATQEGMRSRVVENREMRTLAERYASASRQH